MSQTQQLPAKPDEAALAAQKRDEEAARKHAEEVRKRQSEPMETVANPVHAKIDDQAAGGNPAVSGGLSPDGIATVKEYHDRSR